MTRFKFSDNSDGSSSYEVVINPTTINWEDGELFNLQAIKDGPPIRQKPVYDPRVRTMLWKGCRIGYTLMDNLMTVLAGYVGYEKYFKEVQVSKFDWTKIRVLDLKKVYRGGAGPVVYDVTLSFVVTDLSWSQF